LEEIDKIISLWNEETPVNLQRKFLYTYITWNELVWRAGEVVNCLTDHFTKEVDNPGTKTAPVIHGASTKTLYPNIFFNYQLR
jgi:hypothetical protein